MRIVSECCLREIIKGREHDPYPLGRGEYNGAGITYVVDICSCCGKECDYTEVEDEENEIA